MSTLTETSATQGVRGHYGQPKYSSLLASPILNIQSETDALEHSARELTSILISTSYTHKPPLWLLMWLAISLPLVAWDTLYVHLRPYTMPGGILHYPLWTPYAIYGSADYIYGWPAWESRNGFTAAQSAMNVLESVFYCWYIYVVGLQVTDWNFKCIGHLEVRGKGVGIAVLLAFSGAVMTVSKSLLYWLNEAFSGFANIGHNSWFDLVLVWIIPNGAWIMVPSYMVYVLGKDILKSMNAGDNGKKER